MMRVLGDRVLVALPPDPGEITTASGLVLARDPDILRTPTRGIVVGLGVKSRAVDLDQVLAVVDQPLSVPRLRVAICALGPARFDVALGDCVVFARSAGDDYTHEGITYVVLHEWDIIGVLEHTKDYAA